MKTKLRKIIVEGIEYFWTLQFNCDGDGGLYVKIWKDRKVVIETRFEGSKPVTPKDIRNEILNNIDKTK